MNNYSRNLKDGNKNKNFIDAFGGFNHRMRIGENEFYDCLNVSSRNYPLLSSRGALAGNPGELVQGNVKAICYNDEKFWMVYELNGRLYITYTTNTGSPYDLGAIAEGCEGEERRLINFGTNIVIMPDKLYFNTADTTDFGSIEKSFDNINSEDHYNWWYIVKPCDAEGKEYVADTFSSSEPQNPSDGHVWYDVGNNVIKIWTESYSMWLTPTIYHKYRIQGIGIFKEGSSVAFTRFTREEPRFNTIVVKAYHNDNPTPRTEDTVPDDNDYIVVPSSDDEKIRWDNWNDTGILYNKWRSLIAVEQLMPQMDYLCECQGRLWGCRYGSTDTYEYRQHRQSVTLNNMAVYIDFIAAANLSADESFSSVDTYWLYNSSYERITEGVSISVDTTTFGTPEHPLIEIVPGTYSGTCNVNINFKTKKTEKLNEIYASKQQDFTSWEYYQTTALDSWRASVGKSGKWTGCIDFNGEALFSKEDRIFRIFGSITSQFGYKEYSFEGVEEGAYKSMVVYNGVLYYKGRHGIYAYSGSLPQKISDAFGDIAFSNEFTQTGATSPVNITCAAAFNGFLKIYLYHEAAATLTAPASAFKGLYEYDIERGIWNRCEVKLSNLELKPIQMCASSKMLWALLIPNTQGSMYFAPLENYYSQQNTPGTGWYAETGIIGLNNPNQKAFEKITIRYKGTATIYINYDSEIDGQLKPKWTRVAAVGGGTKSQTCEINPVRCDHFRLKFSGVGEFFLYSIAITVETGSDTTY